MTRMKLLLLLVGLPMGELFSVLLMADFIGALMTLGLLIVGGVAGVAVIKKAGRLALDVVRQQGAGGLSRQTLLKGSSRLIIAGILLIIPGFVSDFIAILLLIPLASSFLVIRTSATPRPSQRQDPAILDLDPSDYRQISHDESKKPVRKRPKKPTSE